MSVSPQLPSARSIDRSVSPSSSAPSPVTSASTGRKRKTPPQELAPPSRAPILRPVYETQAALPPSLSHEPDRYGTTPAHAPDSSHPDMQVSASGRQLSTSKRAEQNRKAQRAFRERRDAHVKQLEARAQLVDAALASADEANRRWEECRTLVDQLRAENAALRAALGAVSAARAAVSAFTAPSVSEILRSDPPGSNERDRLAKDKTKDSTADLSSTTSVTPTTVVS